MSKSKKQNAAVALKYNPDKDYSPVVVAAGRGQIAEKIISLADENGVPVYRDDSTAALLTMVDIGKPVPPELYQVIASIYVEVLKTSNEMKKKNY